MGRCLFVSGRVARVSEGLRPINGRLCGIFLGSLCIKVKGTR